MYILLDSHQDANGTWAVEKPSPLPTIVVYQPPYTKMRAELEKYDQQCLE